MGLRSLEHWPQNTNANSKSRMIAEAELFAKSGGLGHLALAGGNVNAISLN